MEMQHQGKASVVLFLSAKSVPSTELAAVGVSSMRLARACSNTACVHNEHVAPIAAVNLCEQPLACMRMPAQVM